MTALISRLPSQKAERRLRAGVISTLFLFLCLVILACLATPGAVDASKGKAAPLQVVRIDPAGEDVPPGRQITFQFNQPMAALGQMDPSPEEIPIRFEPPIECRWEWIDETTLSCRLDEKDALEPATRYRLSISPRLAGLDGKKLPREFTHTFITERPVVRQMWFQEWVTPQKPVFFLQFNQPVSEESLAAHLYFLGPGKTRIPVQIQLPEKDDYSIREPDTEWLVSPQGELPPGAPVELRVEPGVVSLAGPEAGREDRVLNAFHTIPPFAFLGIECFTLEGKPLRVTPGAAKDETRRCNPLREVNFLFASPVKPEQTWEHVTISSSKRPEGPFPNLGELWEDLYLSSYLRDSGGKDKGYPLPLPGKTVSPHASYRLNIPAEGIEDEFGRKLTNPVEMAFHTDHFPPGYTLIKDVLVLEKGLDTDGHVWIVNLDDAPVRYETLTTGGATSERHRALDIPTTVDEVVPVPLGVRQMLDGTSGVVRGEVSSIPPVPDREEGDSWFFAQVTPFQVHVKLGHHKSLAWVTDLQSGLPVEGVKVEIRGDSFARLGRERNVLSAGETDENGIAILDGTTSMDPQLEMLWNWEREENSLFVFCEKGEDMAVVPLRYDFRVWEQGPNRSYISQWNRPRHGHMRAWGATAQGIYKVGDTIQYKIYVRDQGNEGLTSPPPSTYALTVTDPMGKVVHERPDIELSSFGTFHGEWTVPANGAVGHYRFSLSADFTEETWEPLRVLVSDFTPSPFKVTTTLDRERVRNEETVKVTTEAHLHAGGPYGKAAVRVNARLAPQSFEPDNPVLRSYTFDVVQVGEGDDPPTFEAILDTRGELDQQGQAHWDLLMPESLILYGELSVESAVSDESGRSIAHVASAPYEGRDRYVGLLQQDWVLRENQKASLQFAVVDPRGGTLIPDVHATFKLERRETAASRVKGPGDAYLTQYVHQWVEEETRQVVSSGEPVSLTFAPSKPGLCRISMEIQDSKERLHSTAITRWVLGKEHVVWETTPGYTMDVVPQQEDLKVGDTARFLVQNPFPGARALITVERYGVIESRIQTLESATELLEIPVTPDHLPGFYFSVLVMSPRVDKPLSPEGLDLGKPTFRLGYAQINVRDTYKEITVSAAPDKEEYRPGETVTVNLEARLANPKTDGQAPPMELAVAVLDESVFQMLQGGRRNFDPYGAFYRLDDLDLSNFNLLMQLVGREKLEKKGADAGGGGGPDLGLRSVFKFVCYWNPSIVPDSEGKARIQFELPDNLTAYRILTMAVTPDEHMGLGERLFRVNQPTEVRPMLPNQVLEGDRFEALFSVMNRTEQPRSIEVTLTARGPIETPETDETITRRETLDLEPFDRGLARLPIVVSSHGRIEITARAGDEQDQDGVWVQIEAGRRHSLEVMSIQGATEEDRATHPVHFPEKMRGDTGSLRVTVSPSILGNLEGPFRYMRDYSFTCWEQRLSQGIMAAFLDEFAPYLADDGLWEDAANVPGEVIALAPEHQAPNGGMTFYLPGDEYVNPYLSAFTALGFHWLEAAGHKVDPLVSEKLVAYLENLLRRDAFPDDHNRGMNASVRALALAALVKKGRADLGDAERLHQQVQWMSLFAVAHYLEALTAIENTRDLQDKVLESLMAHADETGTSLTFSEPPDRTFFALLHSPDRTNAAILSALTAYMNQHPDTADTLAPRVRKLAGTLKDARLPQGHWPSTQDNLFAMKALMDYGRTFEKTSPQMEVRARLDEDSLGEARFTAFTQPPMTLERDLTPSDVGAQRTLHMDRTGSGRLYYGVTLAHAPIEPDTREVNKGLEIHREYSLEQDGRWTLVDSSATLPTGSLIRVDLYVHVPAERYYVVVEDPVPGGFEPVSRDLATSVTFVEDGSGEAAYPEGSHRNHFDRWIEPTLSRWNFYHRELRHEAVRFYSERLSAGRYHLSYVAQIVAPGEFLARPARAEEMYRPAVYGKTASAMFKVILSRDAGAVEGGR